MGTGGCTDEPTMGLVTGDGAEEGLWSQWHFRMERELSKLDGGDARCPRLAENSGGRAIELGGGCRDVGLKRGLGLGVLACLALAACPFQNMCCVLLVI